MGLKYQWTADEMVKEGRVTRGEICDIQLWLEKNKNLPRFTEEQIVLFLLSCDRKEEVTRRTIRENASIVKEGPMFFSNRNVDDKQISYQLNIVESCVMPQRTDAGEIILFHRLQNSSFWKYDFEPALKLYSMTMSSALYKYPPTGVIALFDMNGMNMLHITRGRWSHAKLFFRYIQDSLPLKLKEVHILNMKLFTDKLLNLAKPLIKSKLLDVIHFHPSSLDMEQFFKDHIPKKCMPKDYGGDLPPIAKLHQENTKTLRAMAPFFQAEDKILTGSTYHKC